MNFVWGRQPHPDLVYIDDWKATDKKLLWTLAEAKLSHDHHDFAVIHLHVENTPCSAQNQVLLLFCEYCVHRPLCNSNMVMQESVS